MLCFLADAIKLKGLSHTSGSAVGLFTLQGRANQLSLETEWQ